MATKKIQETGPLTYRDLQKMNLDVDAAGNKIDSDKYGGLGWAAAAEEANIQRESKLNTEEVQSPLMQATEGKDYMGRSMWDPDVTVGQTILDQGDNTLTDERAENQPGIAQLAAGFGKMGVLAGTTFLDGTLGLVYGIGTAIAEGRWSGLYDNAVSNGLQEINKWSEDFMPNYRTSAEQNRPWWENMATANFWADSIIKNAGFSIGAKWSAMGWLKAFKALHLLESGLGAAVAGSFLSAVNEGRVESNNTYNESLELYNRELQDAYKQRAKEITDSNMSIEDKNAALDELDRAYDSQQSENVRRARQAGDITLAGNTILLSLGEYGIYSRLFSRGFKNAERTAAGSLGKAAEHADETISKRVSRNVEGAYDYNKYTWKDNLKFGLKAAGTEGNEEMAQQFISNFGSNVRDYDSPDAYYKALTDPESQQETSDLLTSATKAFIDSYGNGDQWEQFVSGALMGIFGVPTFGSVTNSDSQTYLGRGKPIGMSGGIFGQMGVYNEANKRGQKIVNTMNSFEKKVNDMKDGMGYFVQNRSFGRAMDGFAEDKDAFEFKNAEDNDFAAAIAAFAQAGKYDEIQRMINANFENISDEVLDQIAKTTSQDDNNTKDQGWRNPDGSYMSETEEGRKKMREELAKKRDKMLNMADKYLESLERVRAIGNNSLTDEQVNELAWLDWKVGRFSERIKELGKETTEPLVSILSGVHAEIDRLKRERFNMTEDKDGRKALDDNAKQTETLTFVQDLLESLTHPGTEGAEGVKFMVGLATLAHPENKKAMETLSSKDMFDAFSQYSDITYSDYQKALDNLRDLTRLYNARETFKQRLADFTKNPLDLIKNRQKIDKKRKKQEDVAKAVSTEDTINSSSVSDIVNAADAGDIDIDELDFLLAGHEESGEGATPSDARGKLKEARKIRKSSDQAKGILAEIGLSQEDLDNATKALDTSRAVANSEEELFDTETEAFNDPRNWLSEETLARINRLPEDQRQAAIDAEVDKVKANITTAKRTLYERKAEVSKMPTTEEAAANKQHKKEQEQKEAEKDKDKDSRGTSANADTSTPEGSAVKVDLRTEQEKKADEPSTIDGYNDNDVNTFARDVSGDTLSTSSGDRAGNTYGYQVRMLLDHIDRLWKAGHRGNRLAGVLKRTNAWKALIKIMGSDLEDRVNEYINNKYFSQQPVTPENPQRPADNPPTSVPNSNTVEKQQKEQEEQQKQQHQQQQQSGDNPVYGFWKPSTTQTGIHDEQGQQRPYYKTAEIINSVFEKRDKKEALTLEEEAVERQYIAPGYIKRPYTPQQIQRMQAVYEFLDNAGAFNTRNQGGVKVGDTVHFTIDRELSEKAGEPVVLIVASDGTILGDLSQYDRASQPFTNQIIAEWEKAGRPDSYTSKTTTTVEQVMKGNVPYSSESHNVNEVFADEDPEIAVYTGSAKAPIVTERRGDETRVKGSVNVPLSPVKGQPYLLLREGDGTKTAVPFIMKTFGEDTRNTQLGQAVEEVLKKIASGEYSDLEAMAALEVLLGGDFHIDSKGGSIRITIQPRDQRFRSTVYEGDPKADNFLETAIRNLYGTPFEVTTEHINTTYELNGVHVPYNRMIGEVAEVNLPIGTRTTVNNWFTLNPIGGGASRIQPTRKNPNARTADSVAGVVLLDGTNVSVNTSSWRITSADKELTDEEEDIARAMAYGQVTVGIDPSRPYITKWGVFNPQTQKFEQARRTLIDEEAQRPAAPVTPSGNTGTEAAPAAGPQGEGSTENRGEQNPPSTQSPALSEEFKNEVGRLSIIILEGTGDDSIDYKDAIKAKYPNITDDLISLIFDFSVYEIDLTDDEYEQLYQVMHPQAQEQSPQTPSTQDDGHRDFIKNDLQQAIWAALSSEQRQIIDNNNEDANDIFKKLSMIFNSKTGKFKGNVDKILSAYKGKNREATRGSYRKWNSKKELDWLARVLPQFRSRDRIRLVNGLIKLGGRRKAFGRFRQGIIEIATDAAIGTIYHEAFHAVYDALLNDNEQADVMQAARRKYGDLSDLELEERLAEDFRRYVQYSETPVLGTLIRAFRSLRNIVNNMFNRQDVLNKLYYNIDNGLYANRQINEENLSEDDINAIEQTEMDKYAAIEQYHRDKFLLGKLSAEQLNYLKERGITNEEYNRMTQMEKEVLFRCM